MTLRNSGFVSWKKWILEIVWSPHSGAFSLCCSAVTVPGIVKKQTVLKHLPYPWSCGAHRFPLTSSLTLMPTFQSLPWSIMEMCPIFDKVPWILNLMSEQLHHLLALTETNSSLRVLSPRETHSMVAVFAPIQPYPLGAGVCDFLGTQCCIQSCSYCSLKSPNFLKSLDHNPLTHSILPLECLIGIFQIKLCFYQLHPKICFPPQSSDLSKCPHHSLSCFG